MGMGVSQLCAECFNSDDAERKHQLSTKLHDDPLLQNAFDPLDPLGLAQDEPTREPGLLETAHNPVVAGANPSPPKSSRKAEDDTDESDQTTTGTSSFFTDEDDLARPSMSPDDLPRPTHADASGHDLVEVALDGDADGFADAGGGDAKQSLEDHDNDEDDEEQIIVFGGNGGGDSSNPPAAAQAPVRKPSLTMQSSISLTVESETPNTSSQPLVAPAFSSNPFDDDDVPYDNTPDFMNDEPLTRVSSGNPFDDGPDLIGLTEDAFAPATDVSTAMPNHSYSYSVEESALLGLSLVEDADAQNATDGPVEARPKPEERRLSMQSASFLDAPATEAPVTEAPAADAPAADAALDETVAAADSLEADAEATEKPPAKMEKAELHATSETLLDIHGAPEPSSDMVEEEEQEVRPTEVTSPPATPTQQSEDPVQAAETSEPTRALSTTSMTLLDVQMSATDLAQAEDSTDKRDTLSASSATLLDAQMQAADSEPNGGELPQTEEPSSPVDSVEAASVLPESAASATDTQAAVSVDPQSSVLDAESAKQAAPTERHVEEQDAVAEVEPEASKHPEQQVFTVESSSAVDLPGETPVPGEAPAEPEDREMPQHDAALSLSSTTQELSSASEAAPASSDSNEKGSRHVSFAEQTEIIVGGVDGEGADNGFGADVNKEEQFGASGGFAEEAEKNDFEIVRETLHERFAEVEARHPDKRRSSINSIGDGEIEFLHRAAGADDHDDLVSERDSEAMVVPVVGEGLPYADINVDELNRKNEDDVLRKRIERGVYFPHPMEHQGSARDGAIDASDDDESIFASVSADPNVDPEEIRQMFPDRNPAQLTAPSFRSNKEDAKGHRKAAKSMWAVHAMRSLEDADPEEGEQDESTPAAPHEEGTPSPPKAPRPSAAELLAMSPPYPVPDGQNPNQAKKARRRVTLAGPEARQIAEEHGGKNPLEELFHDPKAKKVEAEAEPEPEAEEEEEHGEEEDWEYEDEEIPEGSAAEGEMLRSPSKRHRKPRGNKVAQMMGMFDGNST
mmetsp:Transcript_16495/g.62721  ORF Transcript_16495/g.62721 Transcript_16495/m.62721 type:complete len:1026 (-) Transcript_16495:1745-4822(-)